MLRRNSRLMDWSFATMRSRRDFRLILNLPRPVLLQINVQRMKRNASALASTRRLQVAAAKHALAFSAGNPDDEGIHRRLRPPSGPNATGTPEKLCVVERGVPGSGPGLNHLDIRGGDLGGACPTIRLGYITPSRR